MGSALIMDINLKIMISPRALEMVFNSNYGHSLKRELVLIAEFVNLFKNHIYHSRSVFLHLDQVFFSIFFPSNIHLIETS